MEPNRSQAIREFAAKPPVGTVLAVAAGLSFFLLCMILPLVGPAGSRVEHAPQNRAVFLLVLLCTFALAAAAAWSKGLRRAAGGGPRPWASLALCGVCIATLVVLLAGGFAV